MSKLMRSEGGWVLATAVTLMAVMMGLGLALFTLVDRGSERSREQRERESSLNLAEGVLYAQGMQLARNWPAGQNEKFVGRCTFTGPEPAPGDTQAALFAAAYADQCPDPRILAAEQAGGAESAAFRGVDFVDDVQWRSKVRDNGGPLTGNYVAGDADAPQAGCSHVPCTVDANGDRQLWVHAESVVRGRTRHVVGLLELELLPETTPKAAVTSGAISVTNSNSTTRPSVNGGTSSDGGVYVRCPDPNVSNCANYRRANPRTGSSADVTPAPVSEPTRPALMTEEQLARFKERAIIDGRYYAGCPTRNAAGRYDLSGAVVWIEGCADSLRPNMSSMVEVNCAGMGLPPEMNTNCINTPDQPGIVIWHCGRTPTLGSNTTFVGLFYVVNNSDGTCAAPAPTAVIGDGTCRNSGTGTGGASDDPARDVLSTTGGWGFYGAVAIDGPGCFKAGNRGLQVVYNGNIFNSVEAYGTAGLVQDTWRELPASASF